MKTTTSKDIKTKLAALKEEYINTARAEFKRGTDELFEKYPTLKSFGFTAYTAYTDYFNDGEACTYNVHSDYPDINGERYDDFGYGEKEEQKELQKLAEIVTEFLQQFDDDIFQELVGDHVEVSIDKKGIHTSDYDHD